MEKLQTFLLIAPILLLSLVAHEYAHGYAALRQGDPTGRQLGRLTWNPIKHIDPFMTVLLPIITWFGGSFIFGGAKPMPVNPGNFRNYRRGDIIVSLAGVATNFLIALACVPVIAALGMLGRAALPLAPGLAVAQQMLAYGIFINAILIAFNLLPIPPLDGSHVVKHLLPPAWSERYEAVGRYGLLILILLLYVAPGVITTWMSPAMATAGILIRSVAGFRLGAPLLS